MASAQRPTPIDSRRFAFALFITIALVLGEIIGAETAHSSALLADAGHNIADLFVLSLGYAAVQLTLRQPTTMRSFGFHRSSIIASLINLGIIGVVTVLIAANAIRHLSHPPAVHGATVAIIAACAVFANGVAAVTLAGSQDLNRRVAVVHLASDALSSLAVLITGIVIAATGHLAELDPLVSLGIALLVAITGIRLAKESIEVLLESTPADIDLAALRLAMCTIPRVVDVHDLHCWSLSTEVRALSAHVVISGDPSLGDAHAVGEQIKSTIGLSFGIAHTTLELESDHCELHGDDACAIEPGIQGPLHHHH